MTDTLASVARRIVDLGEKATPGPWTTKRPDIDPATGFRKGMAVAGVAPGMAIYADPPGGSYPNNDREFIVAARNDAPAIASAYLQAAERIERITDMIRDEGERLSDCGVPFFAQELLDKIASLPPITGEQNHG